MKKSAVSAIAAITLVASMIPSSLASEANCSNFQNIRAYTAEQFSDISASDWYYSSVKTAYELGLVNGSSSTTYNPTGNITIAETLALACRIHSTYFNDKYTFIQGTPWYQCYVDYAKENDIAVPNVSNYSSAATRTEFAYILSNSIPETAFNQINDVEEIPDVSSSNYAANKILLLYNSGILTGSDKYGSFHPESAITRSEVSAIITRIASPDLRKTFHLEKKPNVSVKPVGCSSDIKYEFTDLRFEYYENSIGDTEYYGIVGVKNTGNSSIYMDNCTFDLEDNNGHLLQTDSYISNTPDVILPGETGYFYNSVGSALLNDGVSTENGLRLVAQITLKKATGTATNYTVSDTSITSSDQERYFTITGRITNNTAEDVSYLYINIVLYDAVGNVIGISGTSVNDLYAGATVSFDWKSLFINDNITAKEVANFKIIAQDSYYQWN